MAKSADRVGGVSKYCISGRQEAYGWIPSSLASHLKTCNGQMIDGAETQDPEPQRVPMPTQTMSSKHAFQHVECSVSKRQTNDIS